MNTLALALRSLDPRTFELLIVALLKARYPGMDIKHISGQSGDLGLDVISGDLDEQPTIWQCKSFEHGIKDSQKQQIRESLKRALKHFRPRRWVLCVSTDFDVKALRWWQKLLKSSADRVELQLCQATDVIQQLLYQDTIREQFFTAVTLSVPAIREALAGTNVLPVEDLAALNEQNAGAFLARLEQMDSRFSYAITYARNQPPRETAVPGTVLTLTRGHAKIQVTPRDLDALQANPPKVHFAVRDGGVEKFLDLHRTGKAVTFTSEELIAIGSDFDFLMPADRSGMTLHAASISQPPIPFRVTFGKGTAAVVYDYVLFRLAKSGTEESTFESVTPLAFSMTFVLHRDKTGDVQFQDHCQGSNVHDAYRMVKAIKAMLGGAEIEFYDLSRGALAFRAAICGTVPKFLEQYEQLFGAADSVADIYKTDLTVPTVITQDDMRAVDLLLSLQAGFAVAGPITFKLEKGEPGSQPPIDCASDFRILAPEFPDEVMVFGKRVLTGPIQYDVPSARVRELEACREFLSSAPVGGTIALTLDPIGEITIKRQLATSTRDEGK